MKIFVKRIPLSELTNKNEDTFETYDINLRTQLRDVTSKYLLREENIMISIEDNHLILSGKIRIGTTQLILEGNTIKPLSQ